MPIRVLLLILLIAPTAAAGEWISLFNGEDLDDWTPKFAKHEAGENIFDTFRVVDGKLVVTFEDWEHGFDGHFGHLFYTGPVADGGVFGDCRFRAEFRLVGDQHTGSPKWAFRNNGLMILGQRVEELEVDQDFPTSVEVQLLAGADNGKPRACGNACTPGTVIVLDGELFKPHVVKADGPTVPHEEWAVVEVEVRDGRVTHFVNGEAVLSYRDPQLDDGTLLTSGTLSLQAESSPTEFRSVEVMFFDD
ncbi:MAG: DUF1080 domain-containing protein [Planctomycetota bacterium]